MDNYSDEDLINELSERINMMAQLRSDQKNILKELENVNKKLKDSESLKTNFISNIRNEIINPFTSILTLSKSIMAVDVTNVEKIRNMVSLIHSESFDLDFQFKNIFAAASIEAGEFRPEYSKVNIAALLSGVVNMFSSKADQKQINVLLETSKINGDCFFITDSEKLQLIVSNLLSNAIKYSHPGGEVKIFFENKESNLIVMVQDHGIGFDKNSEAEMFNRFTQLDSSLTRSHGGHGLGLSVTKYTIELMNGEIKVTGKKNAGCTAKVILREGASGEDIFDESDSGNEIFFNNTEKF
jgi:signal transduction histidine kinase